MKELRAIREEAGLSINALAELSGVSRVTISRLENGHQKGTMFGTLSALADALHVSVDDLFGPNVKYAEQQEEQHD